MSSEYVSALAGRDSVMSDDVVVNVEAVTKVFDRSNSVVPWRYLIPGADPHIREPHEAVRAVDLRVGRGEALGMIGPNGAGKSTLLKLIAGVMEPDSGSITVNGSIGSMIELGLGFHPDLTARENLRVGSVMHGDNSVSAATEAEIAAFAGLEDVLDVPLKHYSLGMQARLAFAVATQRHVDLLVVDEVLAVGDREFELKCIDRIAEMRSNGTTLLFVSHEMSLVTLVCDRLIHMSEGVIVDQGEPIDVVSRYLSRAASRFERMEDPTMQIDSWTMPAELEPWDPFWIEADITVTRTPHQPAVAVDFTLPTIAPDLTQAAHMVQIDGVRTPGRYRIRGVSTPLAFENALARATVSLVDGMSVADFRESEFRIPGDRLGGNPTFSIRPTWEVTRVGDEPAPSNYQRTRRQQPTERTTTIVSAQNVTKRFPNRGVATFRAAAPGRLGRPAPEAFTALDHLDLDVHEGESVGMIGPNGAGKSTLLRVIAGVSRPDHGSVEVAARMIPMLGVSPGINAQLSGLENLRVIAALTGVARSELDHRLEEILDFAGLGPAIDEPVKHYSSGMLARLVLSLGLHAPGQLMLIDEMLATGDEEFRRRTVALATERVNNGDALLFVSHELSLVEQLCDRVVRLDHGMVIDDGPAADVIDRYGAESWAGGTDDVSGGIRLSRMSLQQRHITSGATFVIDGEIFVDIPQRHARLEIAYRAKPPDRFQALSLADREKMSFYISTLEEPGHTLTRHGVHSYHLEISDNLFEGEFDIVLSVVDERTGAILSETWQEAMVGSERPEGFPGPVVRFDWEINRLDGPHEH